MAFSAIWSRVAAGALLCVFALPATAADYPAPKEATWIANEFRFHTGEVMPELRLHYRTVGEPTGQPVLILHGTAGSGAGMLTPAFAGELFGPGQPLDATKYFIILPDAIGAGKSSKPSDGLRAKFPRYNYDDMVDAQYRLVTEGLGIRHLRLVMGNSMGGMHTWMWGVKYPDFMDALVPMASQPTEMSSRNWMMRRMMIDAIRNDPDWNDGNYTTQPRAIRTATCSSASPPTAARSRYQKARADAREGRQAARRPARGAVHAPTPTISCTSGIRRATTTPSPGLEKIQAALLAINAADDERNPPETGLMEREIKRVKNGRLLPDPGERRHARPRHHRHGEVLQAATPGAPAIGAAANDVGRLARAYRPSPGSSLSALSRSIACRSAAESFSSARPLMVVSGAQNG